MINILGQPNGILDLKKGSDKTLKNIPTVSKDLLRIVWKCINNLRFHETSIFIFFQFYCKINKKQLEIVVEVTYGLHPNQYFEILDLKIAGKGLMKRCFKLYLNSRGAHEISDLPLSTDFCTQKHGIVTPDSYYISMANKKSTLHGFIEYF